MTKDATRVLEDALQLAAAERAQVAAELLASLDDAEEQIEAAVRLLAVAARPIIIAGGGARHAGAELHRLVDTLDCPCVTTAAGKGVLAESHPANLGTSLPYRAVQTLIADADVVLAVGTELAETDLFYLMKLPLGGLLIRIDVDPAKLADHYGADVPVWGDARGALRSIARPAVDRTPAVDQSAPRWRRASWMAAATLWGRRVTSIQVKTRINQPLFWSWLRRS